MLVKMGSSYHNLRSESSNKKNTENGHLVKECKMCKMGAPTIGINGVITTVNGFKCMGNWGYHRYKRSYGTLLITGRGPLLRQAFIKNSHPRYFFDGF